MRRETQNNAPKEKQTSGFLSDLTRFFMKEEAGGASSGQGLDCQNPPGSSSLLPPTRLDIHPTVAAPGRPAYNEVRRSMFVHIGQSIEQEASSLRHKTLLFVEDAIRHVEAGHSPFEALLIIEQAQGFVETMVSEQHKNFKRVYENGNVTQDEYHRLLKEATEQGENLKKSIGEQFQARLAALHSSVTLAHATPSDAEALAAGNVFLGWLLKAIETQRSALLSPGAAEQLSPSRRAYVERDIALRLQHYQNNPPNTRDTQQAILHDLAKVRLTLHLIECTKQMDSRLHDMHGQALNQDVFDYTGHDIDDVKVKEISLALQQEYLLSLNLSHNRITDKGALELAKLVASAKNLRVLILNNNPLGCAGLKHLLPALQQHRTLEYLELQNTGLTAQAGEMLKALVRHNRSLKVLSLSGAATYNEEGARCKNQLEDAGVISLGEGLRENRTLRALDLNQNGITAKGVKALEPVIGQLKGLDVSFNLIENTGFKIIMDNLSPDIEVLKVAGCGLTRLSMAYLAITLKNWPSLFNQLQEWHGSHNPLEDEGVSHFIAALGYAESLAHLFKCYLRNTGELSAVTLFNLHCHYDVLPHLTFLEFQSERILERCQLQKMTREPNAREKDAVMEGKKILIVQEGGQYRVGFSSQATRRYEERAIHPEQHSALYLSVQALPGEREIKTPETMKAVFAFAAEAGSIAVTDNIAEVSLEHLIDARKRAWFEAEERNEASASVNVFTPSQDRLTGVAKQKAAMEVRRTQTTVEPSTSAGFTSSASSSQAHHLAPERTVSEVMRL